MYNMLTALSIFGGMLLAALVASAAWAKASLKLIPYGRVAARERLGRFVGLLHAGVHFVPFGVDTLHRIVWTYFEENIEGRRLMRTWDMDSLPLNNREIDVLPAEGRTQDNVSAWVNGTLQFQVVDAKRAFYDTDNVTSALGAAVSAATREVVSHRASRDIIGFDDSLASEILDEVNKIVRGHGVHCTRFLIQNVTLPQEIMRSHEKQMIAERQRSAEIGEERARREIQKNEEEGRHELEQANRRRENEAAIAAMQRKRERAEAKAEARMTEAQANKRARLHEAESEHATAMAMAKMDQERRMLDMVAEDDAHNTRSELQCKQLERERAVNAMHDHNALASTKARVQRDTLESNSTAERLRLHRLNDAACHEHMGLNAEQYAALLASQTHSEALGKAHALVLSDSALRAPPWPPWPLTSTSVAEHDDPDQ